MSADADKAMEQYELMYKKLKDEISKHDIDLESLQAQDAETIERIRTLIYKRRELNKQLNILNEERLQSFLLYHGANMATSTIDGNSQSKFQESVHIFDPKIKHSIEPRVLYENPSDADDESDDVLNHSKLSKNCIVEKLMLGRGGQFDIDSEATFVCGDSRTLLRNVDEFVENENGNDHQSDGHKIAKFSPSARSNETHCVETIGFRPNSPVKEIPYLTHGEGYPYLNEEPVPANCQTRTLYSVVECDEDSIADSFEELASATLSEKKDVNFDKNNSYTCCHNSINDNHVAIPPSTCEFQTDKRSIHNIDENPTSLKSRDISYVQDNFLRDSSHKSDVEAKRRNGLIEPATNVCSMRTFESTHTAGDYLVPKLHSKQNLSASPYDRQSQTSRMSYSLFAMIIVLCISYFCKDLPSCQFVLTLTRKTIYYLFHWNEEWYRKKWKPVKEAKPVRRSTRLRVILSRLLERFATSKHKRVS